MFTIAVSAISEYGNVPWYSEECSSILATTYSSGSSKERKAVTTDLHNSCTDSHTGTSVAAPLAAGICALALEANPDLNWRDMQHLIVRTSKPLRSAGWMTNGAGRIYSSFGGYGLMNANDMVELAKTWVSVPKQNSCEIRSISNNTIIPETGKVRFEFHVKCDSIEFLEHVQLQVTIFSLSRGDLKMSLISPSRTKSELLSFRPLDHYARDINNWKFMSVHFWDESPNGIWYLDIQNHYYLNAVLHGRPILTLHGTDEIMNPLPTMTKQSKNETESKSTVNRRLSVTLQAQTDNTVGDSESSVEESAKDNECTAQFLKNARDQHQAKMEMLEIKKEFYKTHQQVLEKYQQLIDGQLGDAGNNITEDLLPYLKELNESEP